jgi:PKD repeat protein
MRRGKFVLGIAVLLAASLLGVYFFLPSFSHAALSFPSSATLTVITDDVFLQREGSNSWETVEQRAVLQENDWIKTSSTGRAVINFFEGSSTEIEPDTTVGIAELLTTAKGSTTVSLNQQAGSTWNRVASLADLASRFEVNTSSAAAVVRGTLINIQMGGEGTTKVMVFRGVADVSTLGKLVTLDAGWQATATSTGELTSSQIPPPLSQLSISLESPAWLHVIDPLGRNAGIMPPGVEVNQIPSSITSGTPGEEQIVEINEPVDGTYHILMYARDDGSGKLTIKGTSQDGFVQQEIREFEVEGGKNYYVSLDLRVVNGFIESLVLGEVVEFDYIRVYEVPQVDFTADKTEVAQGNAIQFTDLSLGEPINWIWYFGSGTSTEQNPSYVYDAPGIYTVTLTASNPAGSDTETKTGYITVNPSLNADFSAEPTDTEVGHDVQFTNLTSGGVLPYSYEWDFDNDGVVDSTLASPVWHYSEPGVYTVSLQVTDYLGNTDTETKDNYVTVENNPPVAVDDAYCVAEGDTLTIDAPGVLANDSDINGDPLTAVLVSNVSHGTLTLNPDGSFLYTPEVNFGGTDSFTYRANDGIADSNIATVTVTVIRVDITSHENGQTVNQETITLQGTVSDTSITEATLSVNGASSTIPVTSGSFSQEINVITGENTITVTVTNAQGCSASDTITLLSAPGIRIELTWDTNFDDLDLHLVSPGGDLWDIPGDCYFDNKNPDWDGSGGPSPGDPLLNVDDKDGYGPEYITLEDPSNDGTYLVVVHFWHDEDPQEGSTATVRIWINGVLVFTDSHTLENREVWECARIDWPSGNVSGVDET